MASDLILPLHEYELRTRPAGDDDQPAQVTLLCRPCGLSLAQWSQPPTLDLVIRTAREHERSAHPHPTYAGDRGGPR